MDQQERSWSELPVDILSAISSHVFVGDLFSFSLVCKTWGSAICRNQLLRLPFLITLSASSCKMYSPINNCFCPLDFPELSHATIHSSCSGWLLLSREMRALFFFNPLTRKKIVLPDIPECSGFGTFSFSHPPTSPDCFVVGTGIYAGGIGIIKRGEEEWSVVGIQTSFCLPNCNPFFNNERCFFVGERGNIGIFDVNELNLIDCGTPVSTDEAYLIHPLCIVEDREEVLVVFRTHEEQWIRISRFNPSEKTWANVRSLGDDRILFVSDPGSFLEPALAKGAGYKICFPLFFKDGGVFYALDTRKYIFIVGWMPKLTELMSCAWFKPLDSIISVEELLQ